MAIAISVQARVLVGLVGVSRQEIPEGFMISGVCYDDGTNTPESLFGDSLALNTTLYYWTGSNYVSATYGQVFQPGTGLVTQWDAELSLMPGMGYWIDSPSVVTSVLSGSILQDDAVTNAISVGYQMFAYPYPVSCSITNLGLMPSAGDAIYVWNSSSQSYESADYGPVFVPGSGLVTKWDNEDLTISSGQGFWLKSTVNTHWVVNRPFSLN